MSAPVSPLEHLPAGAPESVRQPRGIYTLFFTEMWERMSYYGMRALLVLYMTGTLAKGGLGLPDKTASAIYGLYVCGVYLVALPGGWLADRLIGQQRAVLVGGIIIAIGHFTLAIPAKSTFFIGLLIVVLGTSLLKPSASSLVGQLYPEGGARRDSGFTLFYMGVNLGGFLGPLVCGYLGERVDWHYGFAAAGVGMVGGVVQYTLTRHHLGDAGLQPSNPSPTPRRHWAGVAIALAAVAIVAILVTLQILPINPVAVARQTSYLILATALGWFIWVFAFGKLQPVEKKRLLLIGVLFIASALFWSGFEQAGSSMNLFAERFTHRLYFGQEIPAGWFQSVNPVFVLTFAAVFSRLWLYLARRNLTPSLAAKFAAGLFLLSGGFLVMFFASGLALARGPVSPGWLITTYLLYTWGELALSPVGLSAVTKLAPPRYGVQTMGIWFLSISLGNLLAGLLAGEITGENAGQMPAQFLHVVMITAATALVLALCAPFLRRLAAGSE